MHLSRSLYFSMVLFISLVVLTGEVLAVEAVSGRFTKVDSQGVTLENSAAEWVIVYDATTGLYWEVKSNDGSIHSKDDVYKWSKAKKEFIAKLNEEKFGGFGDWRLPTSDELSGIVQAGEEPYIDEGFFPNTVAADYLSWRICGSGELVTEKVKFGNAASKGKSKFVRAVRGGKEDN